MNERIRKLRKNLDLTQHEFAEHLGLVQNTITGYETGRRMPSYQVITLICKEFNVNENWLRNGEGEMFVSHSETATSSSGLEDFKKRFAAMLFSLNDEEWLLLEKMVEKIKKD